MMAARMVWTSPIKVLPPVTWLTVRPTANCEIEFISNYLLKLILFAAAEDCTNDELDDGKSEDADDQAD